VTGHENGYAGHHEEDGFFTCAVSVQHKKHDTETGSNYSADETGRRVVWPMNQTKVVKQSVDTAKTFQNTFKQATDNPDHPHKWIQKANEEDAIKTGFNRVSRSRSRSKNIMERARSFERAAAESRGNSRPVSRNGSFRNRSPSGNRNTMDEQWANQIERPSSRTDVDSRRFGEIGRVNTMDWEERIHGSMENIPGRTPPPKRREMNLARNLLEDERIGSTVTPEPPPPPVRALHAAREDAQSFPPPPPKLSEESVNRLSEENKEKIVKEWVESTTQSTDNIQRELEKFAYDIAESVVLSMEQSSDKKEAWNQQSSVQYTSTDQVENQTSGVYHAVPAQASQGNVYVQEHNKRVGMTFQQEERRRQELRRKEEAQQEERRRLALEAEEQERIRLEKERLQQQELMRRREEEERIQQQELIRRKEEEFRLQQEMNRKKAEELRIQQEMAKRKEEEERNRLEAERQRIEIMKKEAEEQERKRQEEVKRQEILRYEKLRQEEEAMRQEEMRLEQEMRRKYELQQQQLLEEQERKRREEAMAAERYAEEQQKNNQESIQVRGHIPKLNKTRSFDHSQDRNVETAKGGDHLGKVKTGQVNEKRNFWIRSTSADRMGSQTLSPAPRRRKIDGWNKQKENEDPDSRPGSSLGQAKIGSVKNLSSGFISKSKSSTAVMQEDSRGRPRQKRVQEGSWTKEKYDQNTNQTFLKAQDIKTNKVNETITTWGKQEQCTSGRSTPVPSRNIGQVFSENRLAKAEMEKSANSWRTKTPEPSVKLMNVSVEKSAGSNQNIHISENAQAQMANFVQESKTMSSSQKLENSACIMTSSFNTVSQPPPAPERNQSIGVAERYLSL